MDENISGRICACARTCDGGEGGLQNPSELALAIRHMRRIVHERRDDLQSIVAR